MEQDRIENDTGRSRLAYVPPLTEVHECELHRMMTQSYEMFGDPGSGVFGNYVGGSAGGASFGDFFGGSSAGGASFGNFFSGGGSAGGASFGSSFSGGGSSGSGSFGNSFGGGGSAGQARWD